MGASKLTKQNRHRKIREKLQSSTLPAVPVGEISSEYQVSKSIIRQDLNHLASEYDEIRKHETTAGNLYEWRGRRSLLGNIRQLFGDRSRTSAPGKLAVIAIIGYVAITTFMMLPLWNLMQGDLGMARQQAAPLFWAAWGFLGLYAVAIIIKKRVGEIRADELPVVD